MRKYLIFLTIIISLSLSCAAVMQGSLSFADSSESIALLLDEDDISLHSPEDKVTMGEALSVLCRAHALNGGIELSEDKSYEAFCSYARENGNFDSFSFGSEDRFIFRYELSLLISGFFDVDSFEKINSVTSLPDVDEDESYFNSALMLYNAGIFTGLDSYGSFYPNSLVAFDELSTVMERLAVCENRRTLSLNDYGERNAAAYLIEDYDMYRTVRSVSYIASGWKYENPAMTIGKTTDYSTNALSDISASSKVTIRKEVHSTDCGVLGFECLYSVSGEGSRVYLEDLDGHLLLEISHEDGEFFVTGRKKTASGVSFASGNVRLYASIDMDNRIARILINGVDCGLYSLSDAADLSRVCISTTDEDVLYVTVNSVFLYRNYNVADTFRTAADGDVPYGWDVTGDTAVISQNSDSDKFNVRIGGEGSATKKFAPVDGKLVFSAYVRAERGMSIKAVLSGGDASFSVEAEDGTFTHDGAFLRSYTDGVWQQIRIEGDTESGRATVKINGKSCGEFDFEPKYIDTLYFIAEGSGAFDFDDVYVYNVYDYVDYCPRPVPVNDDEWYSGMSVCSLWREGSHYGWDCISPYEDLTPALGYYDEGIPEAMDWEIKFMAEHGYDYQRFCWYYGGFNENIKKPTLCDYAIHEGYFNARYSDMLDFSIMWENGGSKGTKDEFYNNIWPYWVDWYLTDERYFCIDNKPVITIYSYSSFINIMGGNDGAKECIDFMESELIKLGYDGIIVYASNASASTSENEMLSQIGFDSKAAYHFDEPASDIDYQKLRMNAEYTAGGIHFTPSCGIGFNDIGWTETRSDLASADDFEKILRWSKDIYLKQYVDDGITDWRSKSVITNTWNEFGEGHYVFPSGVNGFGYMDAHRHVFSSVADTDDSAHYDVYPTLNQKKRLGYLYTARNIPLRKLQYEDGLDEDSGLYTPVIKWDFEKQSDCYMWAALAKTTDPVYDANEKALVGETTDPDGHIKMMEFEENMFSADECDWLHVTMKALNPASSVAAFYFKNDSNSEWSPSREIDFRIVADGEYHDYYVNLDTVAAWQGKIVEMRFDPVNSVDEYAIKKIEFLKLNDSDSLKVNVDSDIFSFTPQDYTISDDGVYVVANPTNGFYSANLLYYQWNRWDGKLLIRAADGTELEFSVGSNKAKVNGEWKEFDKPVALYDGLPMIPLTFIYDNCGYGYEYDENGVLCVEARTEGISDIISSRVPYQYEFNLVGDSEGWKVSSGSGGVADGVLTITASHNGERYDPQATLSSILMNAEVYHTAAVRAKPIYGTQSSSDTSFCFYFITTADSTWNEAKKVSCFASNSIADSEGYYTFNFDCSKNAGWTENITSIRFDPPNREGTYIIDYIRFIPDEEYLQQLEEEEKEKQLLLEKYMCADDGSAFYIENGDCEGTYDVSNYSYGSNSTVKAVEDDLISGNKAMLVSTSKTDKMVWSYIMIPTRFKPGTSYIVEFDVRLVNDCHGNTDVSANFAANFRYADIVNGIANKVVDHSVSTKPVKRISSSDGWVHIIVSHTVSETSPSRSFDYFSIYFSPEEKDGVYYNYNYMVDNIEVHTG